MPLIHTKTGSAGGCYRKCCSSTPSRTTNWPRLWVWATSAPPGVLVSQLVSSSPSSRHCWETETPSGYCGDAAATPVELRHLSNFCSNLQINPRTGVSYGGSQVETRSVQGLEHHQLRPLTSCMQTPPVMRWLTHTLSHRVLISGGCEASLITVEHERKP